MTQITRCHAKVEISLHKKIVALELNLLSIAFLESIEIRKMTIRATAPQPLIIYNTGTMYNML
jgi:hypothetical protein